MEMKKATGIDSVAFDIQKNKGRGLISPRPLITIIHIGGALSSDSNRGGDIQMVVNKIAVPYCGKKQIDTHFHDPHLLS